MPRKEFTKLGLRELKLPGGRVIAAYDPGMSIYICEQVAEGRTMADIFRDEGMPNRATFGRWVVMYPELARAYQAARELSASSYEDRALEMAKTLETKPEDFTGTQVRAYEVAMAQYRWSASHRDPHRYGQQATNLGIVVPIQINTTLDMGESSAGGRSTPDHPDIYQIEAKVIPQEASFDDPLTVPDDPEGLPEALSNPVAKGMRKKHKERREAGPYRLSKRKRPGFQRSTHIPTEATPE